MEGGEGEKKGAEATLAAQPCISHKKRRLDVVLDVVGDWSAAADAAAVRSIPEVPSLIPQSKHGSPQRARERERGR